MKVVVFGSRDVVISVQLIDWVEKALAAVGATEVISGCARGGDRIGEHAGRRLSIVVREYPAQWRKYGRSAGFRRNEQMAEVAEAGIALWDGKSRGTQHMIRELERRNVPVHIRQV
jgi:hypothetical protein